MPRLRNHEAVRSALALEVGEGELNLLAPVVGPQQRLLVGLFRSIGVDDIVGEIEIFGNADVPGSSGNPPADVKEVWVKNRSTIALHDYGQKADRFSIEGFHSLGLRGVEIEAVAGSNSNSRPFRLMSRRPSST